MKINIQAPDFKVRKELADFVNAQVGKLALLSDRIVDATVYLRPGKLNIGRDKICEVRLNIPGKELFASKESDTFENAVAEAAEALKHQLDRWKDARSKKDPEITDFLNKV